MKVIAKIVYFLCLLVASVLVAEIYDFLFLGLFLLAPVWFVYACCEHRTNRFARSIVTIILVLGLALAIFCLVIFFTAGEEGVNGLLAFGLVILWMLWHAGYDIRPAQETLSLVMLFLIVPIVFGVLFLLEGQPVLHTCIGGILVLLAMILPLYIVSLFDGGFAKKTSGKEPGKKQQTVVKNRARKPSLEDVCKVVELYVSSESTVSVAASGGMIFVTLRCYNESARIPCMKQLQTLVGTKLAGYDLDSIIYQS